MKIIECCLYIPAEFTNKKTKLRSKHISNRTKYKNKKYILRSDHYVYWADVLLCNTHAHMHICWKSVKRAQ